MLERISRAGCPGLLGVCVALLSCGTLGCQDGPLYALKQANPYFTMHEWKKDKAYGVTDHQRRSELELLANSIGTFTPEQQAEWSSHLVEIMDHDQSAEMRRIAVLAAGNVTAADTLPVIRSGLDDDSVKVRMEACRALGKKSDEQATKMLVATIGEEVDNDVRNAAMAALGNHQNQISIDALQLALQDRDPAARDLAVTSLKGATGKNYGDDPSVWMAALDGQEVEEPAASVAQRLREFF